MKQVLAGLAVLPLSILVAAAWRTVEPTLNRLGDIVPVLVLRLAGRRLPAADRDSHFQDWHADLVDLRHDLTGRPLARLWSCTRYSFGWLRSSRTVAAIYRGLRDDSLSYVRLGIVQERLRALRDGDNIPWLRRRDDLRPLSLFLRDLLRCPPLAFTAEEQAQLVVAAAVTGKLCVDDRDEHLGQELVDGARPHADELDLGHPAVLLLDHTTGYAALQLGDHDHAGRVLGDVHDRFAAALGARHPATLETQRLRAWNLQELGLLDDAEQGLLMVLRALEVVPDADPAQRLHVMCMLGWVQCQQGSRDLRHGLKRADQRFDRSETTYGDVIVGRERHLGYDHHDTLDARHSLGKVLFARGHWRRAYDVLRLVTADRQRYLGSAHPDTLESRKYAALAAARLGSPATAELRRILRKQTQVQGPFHPNPIDTRRWLDTLNQATT